MENEYEYIGSGVVVDHATDLMWEESGSGIGLAYKIAHAYIRRANRNKKAGFDDWRLPTVDELASLLEPDKKSSGLYIDPIFDDKQQACWTSDRMTDPGVALGIFFFNSGIAKNAVSNPLYVRAVRARNPKTLNKKEESIESSASHTKNTPSSFRGKQSYARLRREPMTVSEAECQNVFKLNGNWRPKRYIDNDFVDAGNGAVIDRSTGLIWEKSGSETFLYYEDAENYIWNLSRNKFAGYDGWRIPTVEELASLLKPEKRSGNLYIDSIFDKKQRWCWTADELSSPWSRFRVDFEQGDIDHGSDAAVGVNYIRAVCARRL